MMVKAALLTPAAVVAFGLMTTLPANAHSEHPCNDSGGPGHSDYAQHHIVPLAHVGALGDGGHKPGSHHHGYSTCLGVQG
jgi:hypothetical protein